MAENSPEITKLEWATTEVEGHGTFKDAKLWPGGARDWDWTETGTDHSPGIRPDDVDELLDAGAEIIVLSQGQQERLKVMDETLARIEERGATAEVLPTPQAVERYNDLVRDRRPVGALIHSTC
jgi:hypothetical protein